MSFRMVAASLVLSTSIASADDVAVTLAPSCAEIDATRDVTSESERALALAQLTRALERANLLVVETGCVDHYVLSHELDGADRIVRLVGPHGTRRVRNPPKEELPRTYARLVDALVVPLAPPAPALAPVASPSEPADFDVAPAEGDAEVRAERTWFFGLGGGNNGFGPTVGYRHMLEENAVDVRFAIQKSDEIEMTSVGARVLHYSDPTQVTSLYAGGGVGLSRQDTMDFWGAGADLEAVVGLAFGRASTWRSYLQADITLPLYGVGDDYHPTLMLSFGLGR